MERIKDDRYYLEKLRADLGSISRHMSGVSEATFSSDDLLQDAMMFRLIQVSENAKKLSEAFQRARPQIPWNAVYGLRNRIVHDYGTVDLHIVYTTLTEDIPALITLLD